MPLYPTKSCLLPFLDQALIHPTSQKQNQSQWLKWENFLFSGTWPPPLSSKLRVKVEPSLVMSEIDDPTAVNSPSSRVARRV
ncbi:unnamed protein product [Protopolystoma xenopodis]|uniref:Uncharacterized protein n=1 Tax=Protopolystoma xenopodis TaxID=117903 RepID=A0A448XB04_9PLAT|nr:unnamed protein product [Protopolystoma xenopodis]